MSWVTVSGNDQCWSEPVLVLPARTQVEVPGGRVQTVTTSPGTAVPVTVWVEFQYTRVRPADVGGNAARMATEPGTAGAGPAGGPPPPGGPRAPRGGGGGGGGRGDPATPRSSPGRRGAAVSSRTGRSRAASLCAPSSRTRCPAATGA